MSTQDPEKIAQSGQWFADEPPRIKHKITRKQLLVAFERLCKAFGVGSAGFDLEAITAPIDGQKYDGVDRWAMRYRKGYGWMIVCGWKGSGAKFTRWNGYIKGRWNFLMFIEGLWWCYQAKK